MVPMSDGNEVQPHVLRTPYGSNYGRCFVFQPCFFGVGTCITPSNVPGGITKSQQPRHKFIILLYSGPRPLPPLSPSFNLPAASSALAHTYSYPRARTSTISPQPHSV